MLKKVARKSRDEKIFGFLIFNNRRDSINRNTGKRPIEFSGNRKALEFTDLEKRKQNVFFYKSIILDWGSY